MTMIGYIKRLSGVVLIGAIATTVSAQTAPAPAAPPAAPPGTVNVEADPIRCWWRTSAGAVRVGETLSLVLTCAVIENDSTKVVPDEAKLDATAMQLPPFEVLGGTHPADLRTSDRRFFQYQYNLRLINDTMFDKDAVIPGVQITYRIQTTVDQGAAALEGRDRTYILPDLPIRILSLVPRDAADIRDAPSETFADIDARVFRANVLLVAAGVLFAFAGLMLVLGLVRLVRRRREGLPAAPNVLSDHAILGKVARELTAVRREREAQGWTSELAGRALAACRVAGGYALGRKASQLPVGVAGADSTGRLTPRGGWLWRKQVAVSGSVTPASVAQELAKLPSTDNGPVRRSFSEGGSNGARRERLEALQGALAAFTAARYGREETLNSDALDTSLADGDSLTRRLKFEHAWLVKKLTSLKQASAEIGRRVWAR
jgi:hypothetical protein